MLQKIQGNTEFHWQLQMWRIQLNRFKTIEKTNKKKKMKKTRLSKKTRQTGKKQPG